MLLAGAGLRLPGVKPRQKEPTGQAGQGPPCASGIFFSRHETTKHSCPFQVSLEIDGGPDRLYSFLSRTGHQVVGPPILRILEFLRGSPLKRPRKPKRDQPSSGDPRATIKAQGSEGLVGILFCMELSRNWGPQKLVDLLFLV